MIIKKLKDDVQFVMHPPTEVAARDIELHQTVMRLTDDEALVLLDALRAAPKHPDSYFDGVLMGIEHGLAFFRRS
jgi:hypothetical protein